MMLIIINIKPKFHQIVSLESLIGPQTWNRGSLRGNPRWLRSYSVPCRRLRSTSTVCPS